MTRAAKDEPNMLLMPKATAVWLIENTALTFEQIGNFTNLTAIEVEAMANEEINRGLVGRDPIEHGEITQENLDKAQADHTHQLVLAKRELPGAKRRTKGPRYTPVSKRGDKPDAIAYIIKHQPDISDAQICKLVGTTKNTIQKIRDRTHPNITNIKPRHPADLGLCSYTEFEKAVEKALRAAGKDPEAIKAEKEAEIQSQLNEPQDSDTESDGGRTGGFDFSNFLPDTDTQDS